MSPAQTSLTFYGGLRAVGGNQFYVNASDGKGILLDFGDRVDTYDDFIGIAEFREERSVLDRILLGNLPPPRGKLAGAYAFHGDIIRTELQSLYGPEATSPPRASHVLISHAHGDHIGQIKFLNSTITAVTGATTRHLLDFLAGISSAKSVYAGIVGSRPATVAPDRTWISLEKRPDIEIMFWETDHVIAGAGAYLLRDKGSGAKMVYTGDIRLSGPYAGRVREFLNTARDFAPDALICEGTMLSRRVTQPPLPNEKEVEARLGEIFQEAGEGDTGAMVFFNCQQFDLPRLASYAKAAAVAGRSLVLPPRVYKAVQVLQEHNVGDANGIDLSGARVYLPRKGSGFYQPRDYAHQRELLAMLRHSPPKGGPGAGSGEVSVDLTSRILIRAADLRARPGRFVVFLSDFVLPELCDIRPPPGAHYVQSLGARLVPRTRIERVQKANWLARFGISPAHVHEVFCPEHAMPVELKEIATTIAPKVLFPVHTERPEDFAALVEGTGIQVIIPAEGQEYKITREEN